MSDAPKRFAETIDAPSEEMNQPSERFSADAGFPSAGNHGATIESDSLAKAGTVEGERTLDGVTSSSEVAAPSEAASRKTDNSPHNTVDFKPPNPDATVDSENGEFSVGPAVPEPKTIRIPKQVAGYEILSVLGRGGMGVVYKARQPGLKRLVALKMILAGGHASEHDLARFRSEAEAVAQLHHPNIVQIYEVGEDDGRPYFSLEFVEGACLTKELDGRPLPHRKAAELLAVLAGAMAYAHEHRIIHRDLKPGNILIATDGTAKITDFGLAKRVEDEDNSQTRSGTIMGTPDYMSPEQASGNTKEVGPLADVYSLGSMFYEFLTGRPPFRSASMLDTLQQVLRKEPVPPSQFDPKLPRDLETICLKCIHKDREKRYASAAALAEDLRRYLVGEPIVARPVSPAERAWRWCQRNPKIASLSATVAVMVVAWAGTASWLAVRLDTEKGKTELALVDAKKNFEKATVKEAEAKRNAEEADRNAEEAEKNAQDAKEQEEQANRNAAEAQHNAEVATENAKVAKAEFTQTADLLANLSSQLQQRLRPKRVGEHPNPEVQAITTDVLNLVYKGMDSLGDRIEQSGVTDYGLVATCQRMGNVYAKLGRGAEAMRQFKKGYSIAKQFADVNPDNDQARANLGLMLMEMGKMEMELNDDARAAREHFVEAHDLQQEILDHPRQQDLFKSSDHHRLLSFYELYTGQAELALGHPTDARRHLEAAREHRRAWYQAMEAGGSQTDKTVSIGNLAESYLWVGIAVWHLADAPAVEENFTACLKIINALIAQYPTYWDFLGDLADIHGNHGDARWRLGHPAASRESYEESLKHVSLAVERLGKESPEYIARLGLLALAHERLGAIDRVEQHLAESDEHYQQALKIRTDLWALDPVNLSWQSAYALALAHCGQVVEAAKQAEDTVRRAPHGRLLLLQAARCFAVCSEKTTEAPQRAHYAGLAMGAIRTATDDDFRDRTVLATDPDLRTLESEPEWQMLLADLESRSNGAAGQ